MTSPNSESIGRRFLDAVEKEAQSSGMTHINLLDEAIPEHWEASDPLRPRPEELEITERGGGDAVQSPLGNPFRELDFPRQSTRGSGCRG